jgi:hypothetical protein
MKVIRILMFLAVCLFPVLVSAQDVITLKSGDEIQAKVTEVGQTEVKYKRFDNPDGPTYTVNKSDIFMVKYQNGQKDVFKDEQPAQNNVSSSKENEDDGEFWKPYKWTNQRLAGISLFADLGGFGFTGSRYGLELRYRRWQINGYFKYATIGALNDVYYSVYVNEWAPKTSPDITSGYGGGFTQKFLFPLGKSNSTLNLAMINEWSKYIYSNTKGKYHMDKETTAFATGIGFGYSYHTDIGFYFVIGIYSGLFINSGTYVWSYNNGKKYPHEDFWITYYGSGELTLGWEICFARKK